jgi:tRNA nucleotidyltransferase/poly(A) polymerase
LLNRFSTSAIKIFGKMEASNFSGEVILTPHENKIFDILKRAREICLKERPGTDLVMRVSGGWVRDKLLGKESHDIDIALDTFHGAEFALAVQKAYAELYPGSNTRGFGVIKSNPDKAKHLETATMNVEDCWLDFVNLRADDFGTSAETAPKFGTPFGDALRRDLTINALFYNINEAKVEDFVGTSIQDLKDGLIRTPLDPRQTFTDDPLRILRVFRFATKFNYRIDNSILEAINSPEILNYLRLKVSRERFGKEIEPCLEHENSFSYLNALHECGLLPVIMDPTQEKFIDNIPLSELEKKFNDNKQVWNRVAEQVRINQALLFEVHLEHVGTTRCYLMLAALMQGFHTIKQSKSVTACEYFIKMMLKLKNKTSDDVRDILFACSDILAIVEILRKKELTGQITEWTAAEHLALWIKQYGNLYPLALIILLSQPIPEQGMVSLLPVIQQKDLRHFHEYKLLLNGNDAMKEFGVQGKEIKGFLEKAMLWQVRNRQGNREELIQWLRAQQPKPAT